MAIELQGCQTKALYLSQLIGFAEEYIKFFTELEKILANLVILHEKLGIFD